MPAARIDDAVVLRLLCAALDAGLASTEVAFVPPGQPEPADDQASARIVSLTITPDRRQRDNASSDTAEGSAEILVALAGAAADADAYAVATAASRVAGVLDSASLRDAATSCSVVCGSVARSISLEADPESGLMAAVLTVPLSVIRETGDSAEDHL